jgi:hypothetical protein
MDSSMQITIQSLRDAVGYTNAYKDHPDQMFLHHIVTLELDYYCEAVCNNVAAWECILFQGLYANQRLYTTELYPLLIEAINRIAAIQEMNDIEGQHDHEWIQVLLDSAYELCLEILRFLAPDALHQVHDILIHCK